MPIFTILVCLGRSRIGLRKTVLGFAYNQYEAFVLNESSQILVLRMKANKLYFVGWIILTILEGKRLKQL